MTSARDLEDYLKQPPYDSYNKRLAKISETGVRSLTSRAMDETAVEDASATQRKAAGVFKELTVDLTFSIRDLSPLTSPERSLVIGRNECGVIGYIKSSRHLHRAQKEAGRA
ncbi:hypothetical protein WMY93_014651 [Mugilogobius chulae]|uniref:Uncharacterized protein n=1 Tax=Mugilogobius chulae TaxID=88201 RepID=A0AAW0P254_9GOBI